MANLICWASGLLQVMPTGETPEGPVIISSGLAAKLEATMRTHGIYSTKFDAYYVPGVHDVPTKDRLQREIDLDRMKLVIAFEKRILPRAKRKLLVTP